MVLAELRGRVALGLQDFGERDVFLLQARPANPACPTVVRPVRTGNCPVMKAARPAVQLGWA